MLFEAALIGIGARLGKTALLTGGRGASKLAGTAFSSALKGSQAGWASLRRVKEAYPRAYGLAGGLATGFALSPIMAGAGDITQKAMLSYYGDTPETRKANKTVNFLSRGVTPYVAGGLFFNAAPITRRLASNPARTRDFIKSSLREAGSMWDASQRSRTFSATVKPISFSPSKKTIPKWMRSFSKSLKHMQSPIIGHPYISAAVAGGVAGGLIGRYANTRPYGADLGTPIMMPYSAMQSSPTGGISPALQMSTYGLPMRIHNRASTRRIR